LQLLGPARSLCAATDCALFAAEFFVVLEQIASLFVLALPVACVAWTVTHEEIFREPRQWLQSKSETCVRWYQRKFCYVWTCEYCFSHYVAGAFVAFADFRLLLDDWRGYVIAWFALVAVANVYMSAYGRLRVEIRKERAVANKVQALPDEPPSPAAETEMATLLATAALGRRRK
jgi:hypothetical protein